MCMQVLSVMHVYEYAAFTEGCNKGEHTATLCEFCWWYFGNIVEICYRIFMYFYLQFDIFSLTFSCVGVVVVE
jgi:hypothetical protein